MKTFNYILQYTDYDIENLKKEDVCFLDIETTGFSRKYNFIYLIGLVHYCTKSQDWKLIQLFSESLDEEKCMLNNFNEFINSFNIIVTYNGLTFDIPFIESRFNIYNIKSNLNTIKILDIYRRLKKENQYLKLENLKLKTVEKSLGIFRHDKYTGKDCIDYYYDYQKTKDEQLLNIILNHNYDDLYYLIPIVKIFDVINNNKILYINKGDRNIEVKIEDIVIKGDIFNIFCKTSISHKDIIFYTENYNLQWINNKLNIQLEFKKGMITPTEKSIFIDISKWPSNNDFKDLSKYNTPNNIILLKVDNKFIIDNIKLIIKEILKLI